MVKKEATWSKKKFWSTSGRPNSNLTIDNKDKELYYFVCPDADANAEVTKILSSNDHKQLK